MNAKLYEIIIFIYHFTQKDRIPEKLHLQMMGKWFDYFRYFQVLEPHNV